MAETLQIGPLTTLDRRELDALVPGGLQSIESSAAAGRTGTSYEPGTITAILILTPQILAALSAWVLKKRRRQTVTMKIEIADDVRGTTTTTSVRIVMNESSTQADVLTALGKQVGASAEMITSALEQLP